MTVHAARLHRNHRRRLLRRLRIAGGHRKCLRRLGAGWAGRAAGGRLSTARLHRNDRRRLLRRVR